KRPPKRPPQLPHHLRRPQEGANPTSDTHSTNDAAAAGAIGADPVSARIGTLTASFPRLNHLLSLRGLSRFCRASLWPSTATPQRQRPRKVGQDCPRNPPPMKSLGQGAHQWWARAFLP